MFADICLRIIIVFAVLMVNGIGHQSGWNPAICVTAGIGSVQEEGSAGIGLIDISRHLQ